MKTKVIKKKNGKYEYYVDGFKIRTSLHEYGYALILNEKDGTYAGKVISCGKYETCLSNFQHYTGIYSGRMVIVKFEIPE